MKELLTLEQSKRFLEAFCRNKNADRLFLVCGRSFGQSGLGRYLHSLQKSCSMEIICFHNFHPNPDYESVEEGVRLFQDSHCDTLVGAGGGSAIDVAKCIRLYAKDGLLTPFLAIPTTAGSGSEATSFAVVYRDGDKQSVEHPGLLPDEVLLCPDLLASLPLYQKKATVLDALCHAVESYWSVGSTKESRDMAGRAAGLILGNLEGYLDGSRSVSWQIMAAAHLAGRAINISKTTAAHAMSYKLTSMYGLPHGHAAAVCLPGVWRFMAGHLDQSSDPRGADYVRKILLSLSAMFGGSAVTDGALIFEQTLRSLHIKAPGPLSEAALDELAGSVNIQRLKNSPVRFRFQDLRNIYRDIG